MQDECQIFSRSVSNPDIVDFDGEKCRSQKIQMFLLVSRIDWNCSKFRPFIFLLERLEHVPAGWKREGSRVAPVLGIIPIMRCSNFSRVGLRLSTFETEIRKATFVHLRNITTFNVGTVFMLGLLAIIKNNIELLQGLIYPWAVHCEGPPSFIWEGGGGVCQKWGTVIPVYSWHTLSKRAQNIISVYSWHTLSKRAQYTKTAKASTLCVYSESVKLLKTINPSIHHFKTLCEAHWTLSRWRCLAHHECP